LRMRGGREENERSNLLGERAGKGVRGESGHLKRCEGEKQIRPSKRGS